MENPSDGISMETQHMKPEMILQADFEDLLFENRNKDYGAYALRRSYNNRMYIGVIVMLLTALFFYFFQRWNANTRQLIPLVTSYITSCPVEISQVELVKPKAVKPTKVKAATIQYTVPVLVKERVTPLAEISELEKDVHIGVTTQDGLPESELKDSPFQEPAALGTETGEKAPEIFEKVEFMPEFPGGMEALYRYIGRKIRMDDKELEPGTTLRALCRFVIDADGKVTQWTLLQGTGSEVLDAEMLRVIASMPQWRPGLQNGKRVAVYFNLPFVFKSPEE